MKSKGDIFCLDTNILVTLHRFYPKTLVPSLWAKLDEVFAGDHVISHKFVFDEICHDKKKLDDLGKWTVKWEKHFKKVSPRQLELVPDVLESFPKLIDAHRVRDQADPWLIAMILEEKTLLQNVGKRYIMICNENKLSTEKIPAACKHFSIDLLNLHEFIEYNGWQFKVT